MRESTDSAIFLTADDLASLLSVSKRSIFRYQSAGVIPKPVQFGRSVRWKRHEIESWIANGCPEQANSKSRMDKEVQL